MNEKDIDKSKNDLKSEHNSPKPLHHSRLTTYDSRFLSLSDSFSSKTIAIIGDLMLDKYIYGTVDRISPEAPVPVVKVTEKAYVPGGAANVAVNVSSMGGKAYVFGVIGEDDQGRILLDRLNQNQ